MTRSNASSSYPSSSSTTKTVLDAAKPLLISAAVAALSKLGTSQQAKDGAKAGAAKFADVKDTASDKASAAGGTLADAKDTAADKLSVVAEAATEKASSAKGTIIDEVVPRVTEVLAGLAASGAVAKEAASDKIAEVKDAANERVEAARETAQEAQKQSRKDLRSAKKDAKKQAKSASGDAKAAAAAASAVAAAQLADAKKLSKRQLRKAQEKIAVAADNSPAVDKVVTFVEDQSNGKVQLRPEKKGGKGLIFLGTLAAAGAVGVLVFQQSKPKEDPWATPLADPYTPPQTGRDSTLGGNISTVVSDAQDGHTDATRGTSTAGGAGIGSGHATAAGAAAGIVAPSVTGEGDPLSAVHRVDDDAQPIGETGEPAATDWQVMEVEDDGTLTPADQVDKPNLDVLAGDSPLTSDDDDTRQGGRHRGNE